MIFLQTLVLRPFDACSFQLGWKHKNVWKRFTSKPGDLRLSGSIIRKSRFIFTKERRTIKLKSGCLSFKLANFPGIPPDTGRIADSSNGVHMYKGVGFVLLILNIP